MNTRAESIRASRRFPKALMISHSVPPLRSGSATIVTNLAAAFSPDELIIAGDESLSVRNEARAERQIVFLTHECHWPLRGRRWLRWLVVPVVLWRTLRLVVHEKCEVIIAVYPFAPYFIAAFLAAYLSGKIFVPYFHNTYSHNRRGLARYFAEWWERRIFAKASIVLVISDGLRMFYEQQFRHIRVISLPHCYAEAPDGRPAPAKSQSGMSRHFLSVAVLGNINSSNLDAVTRFVEAIRDRDEFHLTIYSPTDEDYLNRTLRLNSDNIRVSKTSPAEAFTALSQHDLLLLPHGLHGPLENVEYQTIFPTRVIDYLRSKRPILAHVPRDSFLSDWLTKYQCAEIAHDADEAKLRESILKLAQLPSRQSELVLHGLQALEEFRVWRVAKVLRDALSTALDSTPQKSECEPRMSRDV